MKTILRDRLLPVLAALTPGPLLGATILPPPFPEVAAAVSAPDAIPPSPDEAPKAALREH